MRQLDNVSHAPLLPDPAPGYLIERRRLFNLDTRDLVQDISRVDWVANPQIIDDVVSEQPIAIIEEITSMKENELEVDQEVASNLQQLKPVIQST